ncbi:hypothetical protein B0H21DRAFT_553811 [Amylocystis lapponica]|nr:hypothetical protein B0H21DRAFT_553811 [Amylocystis lapponica]
MSDVRALLKAKRQEIRINHPYAFYSSSGQLQCIACGTTVKHGSSWNGHLGSKAHRMNASRLREQERLQDLQKEQRPAEKRKAREDGSGEPDMETKRQKVDDNSPIYTSPPHAATLPADFFSDPTQAPPPSDDSDDEAEPTAPAPSIGVDPEWEKFQQIVLNAPDTDETYERATVFAEPVLAAQTPQGFPTTQPATDGDLEPLRARDEGEMKKMREQEEKELIMDRLLDEERAQEEADAKVSVLKNKLDVLKRRREAVRVSRGKK